MVPPSRTIGWPRWRATVQFQSPDTLAGGDNVEGDAERAAVSHAATEQGPQPVLAALAVKQGLLRGELGAGP